MLYGVQVRNPDGNLNPLKKNKMLKILNLTKRYSKMTVLDKISFEVNEKFITGIIGPNGAGKSTLLKIITGFENADEGEISFNGKSILSFEEKMSLFSYMPEQLELYPNYYVGELLDFVHKTTGISEKSTLEALGLEDVKSKKIGHLSKGYRQRLKLYISLCNRKQIVVLDEPFEGFDPIQMATILELIRKQREKDRTFILSIHQLYDAEKICDYFVLLDEGKAVAVGDMENLRDRFGNKNSSLEEIFIRTLK